MKRRVSFIHASPAALEPLMCFYRSQAPELEIINLLDDGILSLFAENLDGAGQRLADLIDQAERHYRPELAMLTCSAVPRHILESLRSAARTPVLKIDEPMARAALDAGERIGIAVTFPPTLKTARALLEEEADRRGLRVDLVTKVIPEAYPALLAGDSRTHDRLLLAGIRELTAKGASAIVLAQVSMARVLDQLEEHTAVPVYSGLETSLAEIRRVLDQ